MSDPAIWVGVVAFAAGVGLQVVMLLAGIGIGRMSADRELQREVEELTELRRA